MSGKNKAELILALDVESLRKAKDLIKLLYPKIKIFKVGLQLFTSSGPDIVNFINKTGAEVFLDLKLHDIPNTVSNAIKSTVNLKIKMLTLHILGDVEMLKAAINAAQEESRRLKVKRPLLIGVTVLTSKETTFNDVLVLARLGLECGLDGVVCSVREARLLREKIKKRFIIVTPGIRLKGIAGDDQRRIATISEAIKAGSNFLVMGRPILEARAPLELVKTIKL